MFPPRFKVNLRVSGNPFLDIEKVVREFYRSRYKELERVLRRNLLLVFGSGYLPQ